MKLRTSKILIISIFIGLLVAFQDLYFSGTNPLFSYLFKGILLLLLVYSCIQILKEPNRREKLFQILILIGSVCIGLYVTNKIYDNLDEMPSRKYQVEEISNQSSLKR